MQMQVLFILSLKVNKLQGFRQKNSNSLYIELLGHVNMCLLNNPRKLMFKKSLTQVPRIIFLY
jgi:hypothetical protein